MTLREDALAIVRAAIDGASAGRAVSRALADPGQARSLSQPLHVIAAGKAAPSMVSALLAAPGLRCATVTAVGAHRGSDLPPRVEWFEASHPLPDERSVAAGRRALNIAARVAPADGLLLLLSGGASALMALPASGLSLDDKRRTIDVMLQAGADIHALNTVRKHLSGIKGGRLARACAGATTTWAVSDVTGDDLSVIGSGPGVPDESTWDEAARALEAWGGERHPEAVRARVAAGVSGRIPDTPKPADPALARSAARVIATRRDALTAARDEARRRGYLPIVVDETVGGEAREAGPRWFRSADARRAPVGGPSCILSAGETTVHVVGGGNGGRNQEFVLALAPLVGASVRETVVASVGTDGIDGPTDAAGALADRTTVDRARARGFDVWRVLDRNDSYPFFAALDDLIRTGPTDTNVGDLQVLLSR